VARHERQHRPDRAGQEDEGDGADEQSEQHRRAAHVPPTRARRRQGVLTRKRQLAHGDLRQNDRGEHRDERQRVGGEDERRARRGQQQAADRRADGAGQVLVDRPERDRLWPIARWDELGLECLPGRRPERSADPDHEQQHEQHAGGERARGRQHGESRRGEQHRHLRD
jgi:hypothetical protein